MSHVTSTLMSSMRMIVTLKAVKTARAPRPVSSPSYKAMMTTSGPESHILTLCSWSLPTCLPVSKSSNCKSDCLEIDPLP